MSFGLGLRCSIRDSRSPDQTWRRPALPPLRGQYPGRSAVSRPSSEWDRVGPARSDHQVGAEDRTGSSSAKRGSRSTNTDRLKQPRGRRSEQSPKRLERHDARSTEVQLLPERWCLRLQSHCAKALFDCQAPSSELRLLNVTRALGAGRGRLGFERLGPLGCTCCHASTCGLSTWWSTTVLNETWF